MIASEQARVFLAMAVCGAALGVAYDGLALLRRGLRLGPAATGVLDLAFGALCAAGMICVALVMQVDPFRWYEFAGVATGMLLYALSMGTFVRFVSKTVRKVIKKSGHSGEENSK